MGDLSNHADFRDDLESELRRDFVNNSCLDEFRGDASTPEIKRTGVDTRRIAARAGRRLVTALIVLVVITAAAWGGWSFWQNRPSPPPGTVTGEVLDLTGEPFSGVVISVDGADGIQIVSDDNGRFTFDDVPSGNRRISMETPDERSGTTLPVTVLPNGLLDLGTIRIFRPQ